MTLKKAEWRAWVYQCLVLPPNPDFKTSTAISYRLSRNLSSELIFNESKHQYEDALNKIGFKTYKDSAAPTNKKKSKIRKSKIIWLNPPYDQNVSTNVAKIFLKLVDKHFPRTHRLHKIFNCNTIKVSYSCMSNVQQLIKGTVTYII